MRRSLFKRVLSGVTAALLCASVFSTAIASAANQVTNIEGSKSIDDVTLLVGEPLSGSNPLIYHGEDVESTTKWYTDNFALGIASQFSVFLQDNFIAHNADVEGRMAIGGYLTKGEYNNNNYYDIGKGDFKTKVPLNTLLNSKNYARIIWGGRLDNSGEGLWGISFEREEGIAFDKNNTAAYNYITRKHSYRTKYFYPTEGSLIDFDEQFGLLESRSEQIAEVANQFELVVDDCFTLDMRETDEDDVKLPDAVQCDVTFATLKYKGNPLKATETVYLNLDDPYFKNNTITDAHGNEITYYEYIKHANVIRYENIPKLSEANYRVLNDTNGNPVTWKYSYIVVTDSSESTTVGWQSNQGPDNNWAFHQYTSIKGVDKDGNPEEKAINISSYTNSHWLEMGKDEVEGGYPLQNSDGTAFDGGEKGTWNNNDVGASSILLNFPNATELVVMGNMQGTILAPKAHITDAKYLKMMSDVTGNHEWDWVIGKIEERTYSDGRGGTYTLRYSDNYGNPHISGAVVGKSFEGNIEFGFRPFTGPVRITPASAEYRIGIMKYSEEYDPEHPDKNLLAGATFGLFRAVTSPHVDSEGNTYITFDRDDNGNVLYEKQPSQEVSTSFNTEDFLNLTSGYYMLKEVAAPDGYALDDRAYYIAVSEENHTVNVKTPLTGKDKTVTMPEVRITICNNSDFSDLDNNPIADYFYSAFRTDKRTYINSANQEIKFTLFEDSESIVQGIDSVEVDGIPVTGDELSKYKLIHIEELDSDDPNDPYQAFVAFCGDELLKPRMTLSKGSEDAPDFDGFIFVDEKAVTIKKVGQGNVGTVSATYYATHRLSDGSTTSRSKSPSITFNSSSAQMTLLNSTSSSDRIDLPDNGSLSITIRDADCKRFTIDSVVIITNIAGKETITMPVNKYCDISRSPVTVGFSYSQLGISNNSGNGKYISGIKVNLTSKSGKTIQGAEFELYKETYDNSGNRTDSERTDSWTGGTYGVKLEDIDEFTPGSTYTNVYRIVEKNPPLGYEDPTQDIMMIRVGSRIYYTFVDSGATTVNMNYYTWDNYFDIPDGVDTSSTQNCVIELPNVLAPYNLIYFDKVDEKGNYVAGATIELYRADLDPAKDNTKICTWVTQGERINIQRKLKTIKSDYVTEQGYLTAGVYYFVETAVPGGYWTDYLGKRIYFTIDGNGNMVDGSQEKIETLYTQFTGDTIWNQGREVQYLIINGIELSEQNRLDNQDRTKKLKIDIRDLEQVELTLGNRLSSPSEVKLYVWPIPQEWDDNYLVNKVDTFEGAYDGYRNTPGQPWSDHWTSETRNGYTVYHYTLDFPEETVSGVPNNGIWELEKFEIQGKYLGDATIEDSPSVRFISKGYKPITNNPYKDFYSLDTDNNIITFVNRETAFDAGIYKVNEHGNRINNAKIQIYSVSDEENPIFDGSIGAVGFSYFKPGIYYIVETEAPKGYQKIDGRLYFTVKWDGSIIAGSDSVFERRIGNSYSVTGSDPQTVEFTYESIGIPEGSTTKISKIEVNIRSKDGSDIGAVNSAFGTSVNGGGEFWDEATQQTINSSSGTLVWEVPANTAKTIYYGYDGKFKINFQSIGCEDFIIDSVKIYSSELTRDETGAPSGEVVSYETPINKSYVYSELPDDGKMIGFAYKDLGIPEGSEAKITKIEVGISTPKDSIGKWQGAFGTSTTEEDVYWAQTDDMEQSFTSNKGTITWDVPKDISDIIQCGYGEDWTGELKIGFWWIDCDEFTIDSIKLYTDQLADAQGGDGNTSNDAAAMLSGVLKIFKGQSGEYRLEVQNTSYTADISFNKKGLGSDENIAGAQMQLKRTVKAGETTFENVEVDGEKIDADSIKSETIKWTSGEEATQITGLPDGKYSLTETKAPSSKYIRFEGTITFEIEKGEVKNVVITPSDQSALLDYTIADDENINQITLKNNEYVSVEGEKTWEFNGFTISKTPVEVQLYTGTEPNLTAVEGKSKLLSDTNGWDYKFENLPKYKTDGDTVTEIKYTVKETTVPTGFTPDYSTTASGNTTTIDIENTFDTVQQKIKIPVTKKWTGDADFPNMRPASITVQLCIDDQPVQGKTLTLNSGNEWKGEFTELDKYDEFAKEINYSVKEIGVNGEKYTSTVTGSITSGFVITNKSKITQKQISISGKKIWVDSDNAYGSRPVSITVVVMDKNDLDTVIQQQTVTADKDGNWTYTFEDLDKFDTYGNEIEYVVEEVVVPDDYKMEYVDGSYDIKNTYRYEDQYIDISGTKTWNDDDNYFGKRPTSITVVLKDAKDLDTVLEKATVTPDESGNWSYKFTHLNKFDSDNKEIIYVVEEENAAAGYTASKGTGKYDLVNKYDLEKGSVDVSGTKTWIDDDNYFGKRPESITIKLMNGDTVVKTVTVKADKDGNWKYEFTDLPKLDTDGNEITYTVEEAEVEGYTVSKGTGKYDLVNKYDLEKGSVDVSGTKTWIDDDNYFGKRPESITIKLMNGDTVVKTVTVKADKDGNWKYEFTDLPKLDTDGNEITYSVEEAEVEGYTVSKGEGEYDLINTADFKQGKVSISGQKTWVDNDDYFGKRPESITIVLYADGTEFARTTANADSKWAYSFDDLPKYGADEHEIKYTVGELKVDGYIAEIDGYDITNTYVTTSVKIGKRDITNGKEVIGAKLKLIDKNGKVVDSWTSDGKLHTVEGLGVGEVYTLREESAPDGYEKISKDIKFTVDEDGNITIINADEDDYKLSDDKKTLIVNDAKKSGDSDDYGENDGGDKQGDDGNDDNGDGDNTDNVAQTGYGTKDLMPIALLTGATAVVVFTKKREDEDEQDEEVK